MPLPNPLELLTRVTDDDTTVLGPVERHLVHGNPDLVHRAAHVLVLHPDDGTLLLQKRSMLKDTEPGKWDTSVGGHVSFGQSYEEAALRETAEELGLHLGGRDIEFLYTSRYRGTDESENTVTYLCLHTGPFRPDGDEIDELRFWSRAEIAVALGSGVFTPNFEQEFGTFLASPRASLLRA
jgi:isopentenyldiphosphate isomerase